LVSTAMNFIATILGVVYEKFIDLDV
jgi:hypothetical protein